jgi:hypothetical protein
MSWCPLYRRLDGPQGRSGEMRKNSPPPEFDSRTVQSVTSRCTNYTTPGHNADNINCNIYSSLHLSMFRPKSYNTFSQEKLTALIFSYLQGRSNVVEHTVLECVLILLQFLYLFQNTTCPGYLQHSDETNFIKPTAQMYNCYVRFIKTFPFGGLCKIHHVAIAPASFQYHQECYNIAICLMV